MPDTDYVRDPKSKALINANESAYLSHKASRDAQMAILNRLNSLEQFFEKYKSILEKLVELESNV